MPRVAAHLSVLALLLAGCPVDQSACAIETPLAPDEEDRRGMSPTMIADWVGEPRNMTASYDAEIPETTTAAVLELDERLQTAIAVIELDADTAYERPLDCTEYLDEPASHIPGTLLLYDEEMQLLGEMPLEALHTHYGVVLELETVSEWPIGFDPVLSAPDGYEVGGVRVVAEFELGALVITMSVSIEDPDDPYRPRSVPVLTLSEV